MSNQDIDSQIDKLFVQSSTVIFQSLYENENSRTGLGMLNETCNEIVSSINAIENEKEKEKKLERIKKIRNALVKTLNIEFGEEAMKNEMKLMRQNDELQKVHNEQKQKEKNLEEDIINIRKRCTEQMQESHELVTNILTELDNSKQKEIDLNNENQKLKNENNELKNDLNVCQELTTNLLEDVERTTKELEKTTSELIKANSRFEVAERMIDYGYIRSNKNTNNDENTLVVQ